VAHLSYATTEERLRKEFETFGKIDHVRIVKNLEGKSRGYGFITFRHEKDAIYARDKGDGRRVDNHRILVDKELGRTKNSWLPKRLGGGKGGESRQGTTDYLVEEVRREIRRE
jgi:U1 small nuclear ribonucleoprotein